MAQRRLDDFFAPPGANLKKMAKAPDGQSQGEGGASLQSQIAPQIHGPQPGGSAVGGGIAAAGPASSVREVLRSGPYAGFRVAKSGGVGDQLNVMIGAPAGPKTPGTRGAPPKSGVQCIRDIAYNAKRGAKAKSNPVARSLGLGDCLLAPMPTQDRGTKVRPYVKIRKQNRLTYHVTWAATFGKIPAVSESVSTEYSHRCHRPNCIEERHGCWETGEQNKARARCAGGSSHSLVNGVWQQYCQHDPPCLSGSAAA